MHPYNVRIYYVVNNFELMANLNLVSLYASTPIVRKKEKKYDGTKNNYPALEEKKSTHSVSK